MLKDSIRATCFRIHDTAGGPIATLVLSYHVIKNSRAFSCKRSLKISTEIIKDAHITK